MKIRAVFTDGIFPSLAYYNNFLLHKDRIIAALDLEYHRKLPSKVLYVKINYLFKNVI